MGVIYKNGVAYASSGEAIDPSNEFNVILYADKWDTEQQTQAVNSIELVANGYSYIPSPDNNNYIAYTEAKIYADDVVNNGVMVFHALGKELPSVDIVVNIIKTKVAIPPNSIRLTGINITTPPTQTSYHAGDTFDSTGMVVTASYNNFTTLDITNYSISPKTIDNETAAVVISFTDGGITKTATQPITIIS